MARRRVMMFGNRGLSQQTYFGTRFADRATVHALGGAGGLGNIAFEPIPGARRTSYGFRSSGGSGGDGGSVIVEASRNVDSFYHQHGMVVQAEKGENGKSSWRAGGVGKDKIYYVPCGTFVRVKTWDDDVLGEYNLTEPGDFIVAARGGRGSKGNGDRRSSTKAGHVLADPGESRYVELELRTIADVGLVGKPNAGKSSLLRALSMATPEVASYPFTTLRPHVGVCEFRQKKNGAVLNVDALKIADVPGLIKGAAEGRGLGLDFLRHVFRSHALVFVVDVSNGLASALDDINVLHTEISQSHWRGYTNDDSSDYGRPAIVFANKADLLERHDTILEDLRWHLSEYPFLDFVLGSAKTGMNIPDLAKRLRKLVRVELDADKAHGIKDDE